MKTHRLLSRSIHRVTIFAGFITCLLLHTVAFGKSDRPNFVFIIVDDLRADALGITGHPFLKTPNIDRIGREGAVFKNAFVTTPLCSPARASFLTGQYVHKNGIRGNGPDYSRLSHELVTFPRLLREVGYESAYVGKWHMGNDDSPRPGFDHWVGFKGQGVYENPMININGTAQKVNGYMTDILNEHAVKFVKQPHSKPFVLYFSHKAVHGPFTPAERHKGTFRDREMTMAASANDPLTGKPVLTREFEDKKRKGKRSAGRNNIIGKQGRIPEQTIKAQLESMLSIDEGVGYLLKALEETGQLDNTVVIFTSDNGYFWGEHGLGDKRWAYEESIRVPLLIRYPKEIKAGTKLEHLALNIDIAPTLLEWGRAPVPGSMDGKSLLPLFRSKRAKLRDLAFLEYFAEPNYPRQAGWQAVRSDRYKYIHYTELDGMDEFYDLKADPYELNNLINDPGSKKTVEKFRAEQKKFFAKAK